MKTFILFLLALAALPCAGLHPLDPAGEWMGIPQSDSASTVLLKIIKADRGGWKAICESVNHSAGSDRMVRSLYWGDAPIAVTSITLKDGVFKFSIDALQIEYEGKLSANGNSIAGVWSVDNQEQGPLDFTRMPGSLPVTGGQLEQMLAADKGQSDHEVAQQLYGFEPIERLSEGTVARCEAALPGPSAKQALMALADRSQFLDPPAAEIPQMAAPDPDAQRKMLAATVDYVSKALHRLPNLFATRATTTFRQRLWLEESLLPVGKSSVTVLYRDGKEKQHSSGNGSETIGLTTSGEFGPILVTSMLDAVQGHLAWSGWEKGADGLEAVYHYAVTAKQSHYKVQGQRASYEGEIAIDPSSGAILRVVLKARMEAASVSQDALQDADIVVEYGPVQLGDRTYICPVRSVASSQLYQVRWLNDVVFERYHLFRAQSRILPGFSNAP